MIQGGQLTAGGGGVEDMWKEVSGSLKSGTIIIQGGQLMAGGGGGG